jgi:copper(I)-binding protein
MARVLSKLLAMIGVALVGWYGLVGCQTAQPKGVLLQDAWARAVTPERAVTAFYFRLQNNTETEVKIIGATSPACGTLEIHQIVQQADGMVGMAPVEAFVVPANSTQVFSPGGYHLMCMMADTNLIAGTTTSLTVYFVDDTSKTVDVIIKGELE